MCGLAGVARQRPRGVSAELLERMAAAIRHRGPDGFGLHADDRIGLAHVRLSVIDVAGGAQPMTNEDGDVRVVYNGEIYNYLELRHELEVRGHVFRTRSDTEVLVHGYEQWGEELLERLNGQFAFALHDRRTASLFLARDRFGILPLYYAERGGDLYFASEIKALLASGEVERALDPAGLDEVFTFWAARPPRTPFRGIRALEPGCWARWREGTLSIRRYYALDYSGAAAEPADALEALDELLHSGVRLRMRADVPVGGYLSGGLDSSIVCALAAQASPYDLRTFSVTFDDPQLDESVFQQAVAGQLRSRHVVQRIGAGDIARVFPDVVRHAETPLLRTAPAPLYLLSRLTREQGIKVVLTGEGSDEVFLGYDLFKETLVRLFCLRQPDSRWRPRLFDRLYGYLPPQARLVEFAVALPDRSRLCGLREKAILRRWAAGRLPRAITSRPKQPYRAPDVPAFFGGTEPEYVGELLDAASVRRTGIFNPDAVAGLVRRPHRRSEEHTSELQSLTNLVCRLLLEKKKKKQCTIITPKRRKFSLLPLRG